MKSGLAAPGWEKLSGGNGHSISAPPLHYQNRELAFQGEFDSPPVSTITRTRRRASRQDREAPLLGSLAPTPSVDPCYVTLLAYTGLPFGCVAG